MPKCLLRAVCASLATMVLAALCATNAVWAGAEAPLPLLIFNRPPYYSLQDGKPAGGFLLDIALAVLDRAGIVPAVREMPPSRILMAIRTTDADACAVGWVKTPEREKAVWFSLPLYHNAALGVAVATTRTRHIPDALRLGDLQKSEWNWGLRLGFSYGQAIDAAFAAVPEDRVRRFSDTAQMLRLLVRGRVDALLIEPEELAWLLDREPGLAGKVRLLPLADAPPGATRHIMCGPAVDPAVLKRIDTAIAAYLETEAVRQGRSRPGPQHH